MSVLLLLINVLHNIVQFELALHAVLFALATLLQFVVFDGLLRLLALSELLTLDLASDQVLLHAVKHVVVTALKHLLELVLEFNFFKLPVHACQAFFGSHVCFLDEELLVAFEVQSFAVLFDQGFFFADEFVHVVVFKSELAQSR